ncbi:uncharacterized protein [Prorops nasuta]|uniref:uncharacterized protein isoform X2 n=1 Tax=Prorops nasuta TaxID=863751 RepID=UPI0034CE216A
MGKTRGVHETTPELRNRMVGMYEAGLGLREIAAAVNCSQRTVKRWLNRFDKEGTVETRERCGRKRATTNEQDEAIIRLATQTPITAAKAVLPALGLTCSVDTVRERLHKAGIHNWSPSRKYMQRIPLGSEMDGAAIQQAVWRPTGTQLGKKKSSKDPNKTEKNNSSYRKKTPTKKVKTKDVYTEDVVPATETAKQSNVDSSFSFSQQAITQSQNSELQVSVQQTLPLNQTEFCNTLSLAQQHQPIYQHTELNITQSWPLDLVQSSQHYHQGQPQPVSHEEPPQQHQLQELHTHQEQHHLQQVQQKLDQLQEHTQESYFVDFAVKQEQLQQQGAQSHHHNLERKSQIHSNPQVQHLQPALPSPQNNSNLNSDSCSNSCSSNDNSQMEILDKNIDQSKSITKNSNQKTKKSSRKKKGGKAKGTLETSVELRNRMIGMSEAGLSTLSIALAIDRSERTVKRWLERWHKEGNVQTKERKGRRRITTKEEDDAIVAMATQHPLTAAKYVAPALGLKCSVDTIRERLHKAGIHSWKLGKKQGEGNAVHTVHLWQPSGNRPNKPKASGEKKKKSTIPKKDLPMPTNTHKKNSKKKNIFQEKDSSSPKVISPPVNMITEQQPTMQFHNSTSCPTIMQVPIHNIPGPSTPLTQAQPAPPGAQTGPPPMQPIGPIIQQRSDCRLAPPIGPSVSVQGNSGVIYHSCMVGNTNHASHMEQSDPLNYEPYIWSF